MMTQHLKSDTHLTHIAYNPRNGLANMHLTHIAFNPQIKMHLTHIFCRLKIFIFCLIQESQPIS